MNEEKSIILKCDCHAEAMEITYEPEFKQFWFAYWGYGFTNKKLSFFRRIKWAFKLLITGTLYTDFVILDDDKAKQLADFINENKKQII